MKACGVAVARLQGHSWAPTPSKGSRVNVGTIPAVPSPASGLLVGGKARRRLMRTMGLRGATRAKKRFTTRSDPCHVRAPDLVKRKFAADRPDRLWVADFERHEALPNSAVVKGHRRVLVAAGALKLRAA